MHYHAPAPGQKATANVEPTPYRRLRESRSRSVIVRRRITATRLEVGPARLCVCRDLACRASWLQLALAHFHSPLTHAHRRPQLGTLPDPVRTGLPASSIGVVASLFVKYISSLQSLSFQT